MSECLNEILVIHGEVYTQFGIMIDGAENVCSFISGHFFSFPHRVRPHAFPETSMLFLVS